MTAIESGSRRGLLAVLASEKLQRLFWLKVDRNGPVVRPDLGPCAIWTRSKFKRGGYGAFCVVVDGHKVALKAHQVGFVLGHGRLPERPVIRHQCDVVACVIHVMEGTHADNVQDKCDRNRVPRGERHWASKLTDEETIEMRAKRAAGASLATLAKAYGVSKMTVSMVCSGKRREARA